MVTPPPTYAPVAPNGGSENANSGVSCQQHDSRAREQILWKQRTEYDF